MLVLVLLPICLLSTFDYCYRDSCPLKKLVAHTTIEEPTDAPVGVNLLSRSGLNSYPSQRVLILGNGKFLVGGLFAANCPRIDGGRLMPFVANKTGSPQRKVIRGHNGWLTKRVRPTGASSAPMWSQNVFPACIFSDFHMLMILPVSCQL